MIAVLGWPNTRRITWIGCRSFGDFPTFGLMRRHLAGRQPPFQVQNRPAVARRRRVSFWITRLFGSEARQARTEGQDPSGADGRNSKSAKRVRSLAGRELSACLRPEDRRVKLLPNKASFLRSSQTPLRHTTMQTHGRFDEQGGSQWLQV